MDCRPRFLEVWWPQDVQSIVVVFFILLRLFGPFENGRVRIFDIPKRKGQLGGLARSRKEREGGNGPAEKQRRRDRNEKHSVSACRESVVACPHSGLVFVCDFLGLDRFYVSSNMDAQDGVTFRYPVYPVHPCWNFFVS